MKYSLFFIFIICITIGQLGCKKENSNPSPIGNNNQINNNLVGTWAWFESYRYLAKSDGTVCKNEILPTFNLTYTFVFNADGTYRYKGGDLNTYTYNESTGEIFLNNFVVGVTPTDRIFLNVKTIPYDPSINAPTANANQCIYWNFDHSDAAAVDCHFTAYLKYHYKKL